MYYYTTARGHACAISLFQMQQGEDVHQANDAEVPGAEAAVDTFQPWLHSFVVHSP